MSLGAPGLDAIEPCGDHHMTLMSETFVDNLTAIGRTAVRSIVHGQG